MQPASSDAAAGTASNAEAAGSGSADGAGESESKEPGEEEGPDGPEPVSEGCQHAASAAEHLPEPADDTLGG